MPRQAEGFDVVLLKADLGWDDTLWSVVDLGTFLLKAAVLLEAAAV